jgi:hypothetical protein
MEALIPSEDLDKAYADAFTNMSADKSISDDTKRFLFFHKNTIVRVDTVLGAKATKTTPAKPPATLADIVISKDPNTKELTVTLKGEKRVNKTRLDVTYKGTMAAFLKEQFDISKAANPGKKLKDIKLFDTTKNKTDAAHNKHIKPIVEERFPTAIPVDPKSGDSAWRPTDIRSAVQDQLEKEFEINFALAEDFAGHKVKDAYKSAQANPAKIGEIAENLVRQTAKNLNTPTTNSVIAARFGIPTTVFNAEGTASFPALVEDYRGAGQVLQPAVPLTEAQKADMDATALLSAEKQTAEALDLQQQNIEKAAALDVDKAKQGIEKQDQLAALKKEQRQEKLKKTGRRLIDIAKNMDTSTKRAIVGGLGTTAAVLSNIPGAGKAMAAGLKGAQVGLETAGVVASTQEGLSTREQLMGMGIDPTLASATGTARGVADFLSPLPIDAVRKVEPDVYSTRPIDRVAADDSVVAQSLQDTGNIGPEVSISDPVLQASSRGRNVARTKQIKIPSPVAPRPQMAAQGFVPVSEARANAMRGEETTMKESQVPSFLHGGIVR